MIVEASEASYDRNDLDVLYIVGKSSEMDDMSRLGRLVTFHPSALLLLMRLMLYHALALGFAFC